MTMAEVAHDLNAYSKGRFTLGLGSQVKAHIKWRFNMPWSAPAARMKEYVQALNAIWDAWYDGKPLEFRGAFYTHTLMPPRFTPQDTSFGRPRVCVAAVGPLMTKAAAEVADGVICHAFTTARYLREVTLPAIESTLAENGRARGAFELLYPPFVALVKDDAELEAAKVGLRRHIAFYASTPAYRGVLDLHGWGELQPALAAYVRADRWEEMGDLIDETMLRTFAVFGDVGQVAEGLGQFKGMVDGFNLNTSGMAQEDIAELTRRLAG
jgi:probable F420-dependent oxidoreductase